MQRVTDDILFRIREANDIIDIISARMNLKKAGKNYKGLCPFHSEKSPSFSVNPDKQFFHCFGCGEGGDIFTFLMKYENISFYDAIKTLAGSAGITLETEPASPEKKQRAELRDKLFLINEEAANFFVSNFKTKFGEQCIDYLKNREMTKDSIKKFKIGVALDSWDSLLKHLKSKGYSEEIIEKAGLIVKKEGASSYYDRFRKRLIFPILNTSGNVIGFGGRVLDDSLPKYLNSPETPLFNKGENLYALFQAKESARKLNYLIIVEGYLDAITPNQYGVENVVATLGTALTENHIRLIKRYVKKVVLIFDPDEAGTKAALRGLDLFLKTDMKANVVALKENLDPDNFMKKYGKDGFLKELTKSVRILDFFINYTINATKIKTIDDKISIVNEILPKIRLLKNAISRDHYLKKLSEKLEIKENLLRQELIKGGELKNAPTPSMKRESLRTSLSSPILNAEETLLKVILSSSNIALRAKDILNLDDICDPSIQNVIEKVFNVVEPEKEIDTLSIIDSDDEELKNSISKLLLEDSLKTDNELERAFVESIFKVQQSSIDRKLEEIQALIVKATKEKNEELKEELLKEYVNIGKIKNELKKPKH
ncbi:DNA primase [Thermodesulfobacteriota bacterium]